MESFISTIGDLFLMTHNDKVKFGQNQKQYVIPKYQREYTWTEEKVMTLISDINNRDKFLGNIILNKIDNYYEIVDGQQRITTIILILIALFNINKISSSTSLSEEQRDIICYIYKDNHTVLQNESLGEYIHLFQNEIALDIKETNDIYYQKKTFDLLYEKIEETLAAVDNIANFQKKVLDCEVLVLIGEAGTKRTESIEEIFLDINFKSQLLSVADIFKGYCFKIYPSRFHEELKKEWTVIRKYIKDFEAIGYDENQETCEYIYHYLLSQQNTYRIPANLSINGKHYLEGKSITETKNLLEDMGNYGKNIMGFIQHLNDNTYKFEDICADAVKYHTDIVNHEIIKKLFLIMICNPNVQYYKLPLFMFIHYLIKNDDLRAAFSYRDLKKFVTNYYAYAFFFINDRKNKNKTAIDQTIFNELYKINSGCKASDVIVNIMTATKDLRNIYLESYNQFSTFSSEKAYALYSFIDNYQAKNNYISTIYEYPQYNIEHLLLHDNSKINTTWEEGNNKFTFSLRQLLGKSTMRTFKANKYRNMAANYIIIPKELNEILGQKDIVEKIVIIKDYYDRKSMSIPKHISIFLENIESFSEYNTLVKLKGQGKMQQEIEEQYQIFINAYFNDDKQRILYEKIEKTLRESFKNV